MNTLHHNQTVKMLNSVQTIYTQLADFTRRSLRSLSCLSMLVAFACCMVGLTACSDDDDDQPAKPVVNLTEVGHDNSLKCHPGHDLHLEASVVAEGLIQRIDLEIHQEGSATKIVEQSFTTGKYIGVRNTEFHEHVDIPDSAALGSYHLHFTVTDRQGQQTVAESHLELVEADGDEEEHHHE